MPATTPAFVTIAERLVAAGLPLPAPLVRAVERDPVPLAVGSHEAWQAWAGAHGYGDKQIVNLLHAIRSLTGSKSYLEALTAEFAQRHDVDGKPVGAVSDEHRAIAVQMLLVKVLDRLANAGETPRGAAIAAVKSSRAILSLPRRKQG